MRALPPTYVPKPEGIAQRWSVRRGRGIMRNMASGKAAQDWAWRGGVQRTAPVVVLHYRQEKWAEVKTRHDPRLKESCTQPALWWHLGRLTHIVQTKKERLQFLPLFRNQAKYRGSHQEKVSPHLIALNNWLKLKNKPGTTLNDINHLQVKFDLYFDFLVWSNSQIWTRFKYTNYFKLNFKVQLNHPFPTTIQK